MTRYELITRKSLIPGQGRKIGMVWIVRGKGQFRGYGEVATAATHEEGLAKLAKYNGQGAGDSLAGQRQARERRAMVGR